MTLTWYSCNSLNLFLYTSASIWFLLPSRIYLPHSFVWYCICCLVHHLINATSNSQIEEQEPYKLFGHVVEVPVADYNFEMSDVHSSHVTEDEKFKTEFPCFRVCYIKWKEHGQCCSFTDEDASMLCLAQGE